MSRLCHINVTFMSQFNCMINLQRKGLYEKKFSSVLTYKLQQNNLHKTKYKTTNSNITTNTAQIKL